MSLVNRTRAVARAQPADSTRRALALAIGTLAVGVGLSLGISGLAAAGAVLVGYQFRPEAERYYLEGFSDGLVVGPQLEAGGSDRGRVRALPDGAPDDGSNGPPGAPDGDQRAAGIAEARDIVERARSLRGAFGLAELDRPAGPALDREGSAVLAQGPRSSSFPEIPAAEPAGPVGEVLEDRATARRQARRRERPGLREA